VDSNHWPHPPEALRSGRPAPIGADLRRGTPGDPGEYRGSPTRLVPGTVPQSRRARRKIAGKPHRAKRPAVMERSDEGAEYTRRGRRIHSKELTSKCSTGSPVDPEVFRVRFSSKVWHKPTWPALQSASDRAATPRRQRISRPGCGFPTGRLAITRRCPIWCATSRTWRPARIVTHLSSTQGPSRRDLILRSRRHWEPPYFAPPVSRRIVVWRSDPICGALTIPIDCRAHPPRPAGRRPPRISTSGSTFAGS
jgi:hypothetical protein